MHEVSRVSAQAHIAIMQACPDCTNENQLESVGLKYLRDQGLSALCAYPPIFATGRNAIFPHYMENSAPLVQGEMVLIDFAGMSNEGYASDITRTFPVSGKFSALQAEFYTVVLKAQKLAIATIREGNTWRTPHNVAMEYIITELHGKGVLKGKLQKIIKRRLYSDFNYRETDVTWKILIHATSHFIGLYVHDVGKYYVDHLFGEASPILNNSVMTVEPGLYFIEDKRIPQELQGLGFRIEDVVVPTSNGPVVLSADVPKEIAAIESLMQTKQAVPN